MNQKWMLVVASLIVACATSIWLLLGHSGSVVPRSASTSFPSQRESRFGRFQEIDTASDPWRTPIAFYGKVVDESNQPVAGVSVSFSCNDLSREGTSKYQTTSDGQGLFSLKGVKGKLLVLRLSKEGYYTSKRDNDSFDFAGDGRGILVLDPANPIVFHLQNRGHAEPLLLPSK